MPWRRSIPNILSSGCLQGLGAAAYPFFLSSTLGASGEQTGALSAEEWIAYLVVAMLIVFGVGAVALAAILRKGKLLESVQRLATGEADPPPEAPLIPKQEEPPADPTERHRLTVAIESRGRFEACRIAQALAKTPPASGSSQIWILAGPGLLGAAGMAAARHLESLGLRATVQLMVFPDRLGPEAAAQRKTLAAAKLPVIESPHPQPLRGVRRVVDFVKAEELGDARRRDWEAILARARSEEIETESAEEFSAHFVPPAPSAEDLVIPVPEGALTREEVRFLDALAQQHYGISGAALMENAGYWTAREAALMAQSLAEEGAFALSVVCGRGNNGGDGLVVARHLHRWGFPPNVFLLGPKDQMTDDAGRNLALYERDGGEVHSLIDESQWPAFEQDLLATRLIVDAVLGTGMTGPVRGPAAQAIELICKARQKGAWVLAVDCPSGIDCNTGQPLGACVRADLTVTYAARKIGFEKGAGPELCGKVVAADIGLPRELYRRRAAGEHGVGEMPKSDRGRAPAGHA